jgi:hypothetical protein
MLLHQPISPGIFTFVSCVVQVLQHGACLGLGLAAMATGTDELYVQMRDILFQDSAVAGEGAGIGIGLLLREFYGNELDIKPL